MIKAEIVAHSLAPSGVELITYVLTYPRFIHAEFMTHRVFSRNASSSRAIPVKKSIQMVVSDPVIPLAFTKNQKGMQGGEALTGEQHEKAVAIWLKARDAMVDYANQLADLEVHKQYANRLLEPFAHITVVVTSCQWDNFFALRYHGMAQPEICELAKVMYKPYKSSKPNKLAQGEWHLPFIPQEELDLLKTLSQHWKEIHLNNLIKQSVASCARVSYLNHDGTKSNLEDDIKLYNRLVGAAPIHASPAEHQAMAVGDRAIHSGNFIGWVQYRKTLVDENVTSFYPPEDV